MEFEILPLTSNNYSKIVRYHNSDLLDLETLKMYEEKATSETFMCNLGVLTPRGSLVGFGMSVSGTWDPILKPGYVEVTIKVGDKWRNYGVGSMILNKLEDIAIKHNAVALQTSIQDTKEKELDWAKKNGFMIDNHVFESRLDISLFDLSQYNNLFKELEDSGIRFTSLSEYPQTEDSYNRYWDFWWELVKDVPGMNEKPRPDNDRMNKLTKDVDNSGFILAVDNGKWVAMSMIIKETDEVCYNSMTGVKRYYRGKGLAQAMKIKAMEYALQNNVKYIRTHNDSKNAPMLSVDKKLGYKQKPGIFGLVKWLK